MRQFQKTGIQVGLVYALKIKHAIHVKRGITPGHVCVDTTSLVCHQNSAHWQQTKNPTTGNMKMQLQNDDIFFSHSKNSSAHT